MEIQGCPSVRLTCHERRSPSRELPNRVTRWKAAAPNTGALPRRLTAIRDDSEVDPAVTPLWVLDVIVWMRRRSGHGSTSSSARRMQYFDARHPRGLHGDAQRLGPTEEWRIWAHKVIGQPADEIREPVQAAPRAGHHSGTAFGHIRLSFTTV